MRASLLEWSHPFHAPLVTAAGTFSHRQGWCITVEQDGRMGVGEGAPLPGFSEEDHAAAGRELRAWAAAPDPTQLPALPSARHAVHQALLALRSGTSDAALLLCDDPAASVPVNAIVRDATEAAEAVTQGFSTVKLKVGLGSLQQDLARVRAVREAIGPHIALRLDANARWSLPEAETALSALLPFRPQHVEQPVASIADLARLRGLVPLAADESMRSAADLEALLAHQAVDAVVLKPMLLGGLDRCVALGRLARQEGLDVWVTTSLDGSVARHGALLAARCIPDVLACGLATGRLLQSDHGPPLTLRHGAAWS